MNMKRILALVLALTLAFSLVMPASVFADGETVTVTYKVDKDGAVFTTQTVETVYDELFMANMGTVTQPEQNPTKADADGIHYVFVQWVSEQGTPFFDKGVASVEEDATVTAQFEKHLADGYQLVVNTANGPEYRTDTSKTITELTGNDEFIRIEAITQESAPKLRNSDPVAQVDNVGFGSLADAVAAAQAGDTVVLLANYTLPATIVINKSITLNLNGKTLTCTSAAAEPDRKRIEIASGAEVTLSGVVEGWSYGTIANATTIGDAHANGYAIIKNEGALTLEKIYVESDDTCIWVKGGTLNADYSVTVTSKYGNAIATNGSKGNAYDSSTAVVNIDGATIKSTNDVAVYVPAGTFNIIGGNITGATGVYMKGGTLSISGSIITGNGAKAAYSYNGNGSDATGDALVIDVCGYPYGADPAITVTGGTFKSVNGSPVASYANTGYTAKSGFLSGGDFYGVVPEELVANNCHLVETYSSYNGTYYVVKAGDAVANWSVGEDTYEELSAAINHAGADGTVKLENALTDYVIYSANNPITIDLNGNSITHSGSYTMNLKNTYGSDALITITGNGTVTNTGTSAYSAALDTDGNVVVKSGTFTQTNENSNALYVTGGPVLIEGGTFNGNLRVGSYAGDNALTITGGTFTVDPSAYVVEGYEAVKSGANFVVVAEGAAQAEMNGVKYATLRDAYLAALAGGTGNTYEIELLKDAEGPAWGSDGDAAITYSIDFNGHTYTVTRPSVGSVGYETQAVRVISGQTVTMENGTITSSDAKMLFNVYSDLTLNNMVLDGSNLVNVANGNYTLSDNKGNIVVNNTTIIPDGDANDFAFDVWGGYNGGKTNVSVTITGNSVIQGAFEYTAANEGYSAVLTVEGGTFATDPSDYVAEGYECNAQGNVYVVEAHVHTYGNPDWNWRLINGNWAAVASFNCVKGDDTQNVRATITSEEDGFGHVIYTATVNFRGQEYTEQKTLYLSYPVFFDGGEGRYAWGELCTLNSPDGMNKKWYINGILVADGRSSYTFAVTADADVTFEDTEEQNPVAVMSATLYSPESGVAVYNVKWSLPTGSEVVSAMIYRGAKSSAEPATVELLTSKGVKIDTGMYVRNGDYTLNITGLTPTKYQNVVAVITYRVGGQTKTLIPNCGVLNVQADGPHWA